MPSKLVGYNLWISLLLSERQLSLLCLVACSWYQSSSFSAYQQSNPRIAAVRNAWNTRSWIDRLRIFTRVQLPQNDHNAEMLVVHTLTNNASVLPNLSLFIRMMSFLVEYCCLLLININKYVLGNNSTISTVSKYIIWKKIVPYEESDLLRNQACSVIRNPRYE